LPGAVVACCDEQLPVEGAGIDDFATLLLETLARRIEYVEAGERDKPPFSNDGIKFRINVQRIHRPEVT
jgi:hypothetical protein